MVKINRHAKYLGQRSFRSTVIIRTHTHTVDQQHYADHKLIGNKLSWRRDILYSAFWWIYSPVKRSSMARANDESHSFTCHQRAYPRMQWAIPRLLPSRMQCITALWPVLVSHPTEGRRLSWPGWLVTFRDCMPARRRSPSQYQPTDSAAAGDRTHDHWVASLTP